MNHVIAIVVLAVCCVIWYFTQRLTGRLKSDCSGSGSCSSGGEKKGNCLFCGNAGDSHDK